MAMNPRRWSVIALVVVLVAGAWFAWRWKEGHYSEFAQIHARCVEHTTKVEKDVGGDFATDIDFAVERQCGTSPAAFEREFRSFSDCVENEMREVGISRRSAESNCSARDVHGDGDLWDDMFWQVWGTTPSGHPKAY